MREVPWREAGGGLLLLVLVAGGCAALLGGSPTAELREILGEETEGVILPTWTELVTRSQELPDALASLCDHPDSGTLEEARSGWRQARSPWKEGEAFAFGPADDLSIIPAVDFWPLRADNVEAVLSGSDPVDAAAVAAMGVTTKGFPVLEYLLWRQDGDDSTLLAGFTGEGAERRCQYLISLGEDLAANAQALMDAWDPEAGAYATELSAAGQGSTLFPTVKDAMDTIITHQVAVLEILSETRLGKPLGVNNDGTPQPETVEASLSGNAVEDLLESLAGLLSLYTGDWKGNVGRGMDEFVYDANPAADETLKEQFTNAREAIAAIPSPLQNAVLDDPDSVRAAYDSLLALLSTFSVDLAGVVGGTVSFTGNDGD